MTDWPSDEDVRKALVALHGHADVFPVHYERARQALMAGTEGLRAKIETLRWREQVWLEYSNQCAKHGLAVNDFELARRMQKEPPR